MSESLFHKVRRAYERDGKLFEVQCDVLYQCDLDCEHCYLDDKSRPVGSTAFWCGVFDQLADMEVFLVNLSGGEFFLRKDAFELIAHARRRGLLVLVKSHGGRLDEDGARRLAELGVSQVQISYYSHRPEVHDAITQRSGSHARTEAAMEALVRHGVRVVVNCVVMRRNHDHIRETVEHCRQLGALPSLNGRIRLANSGDDAPRDTALDAEDLVDVEQLRIEEEPHGCGSDEASWGDDRICVAGHLAMYIDPEGRVMPCASWPLPLGDLTRGDRMADIWESSGALRRIRAFRNDDRSVCARCPLRSDCDFCPGEAQLEAGDPMRPPTPVCEETLARARARARQRGEPEPPLPPPLREEGAGSARPRFPILGDREAREARARPAAGSSAG